MSESHKITIYAEDEADLLEGLKELCLKRIARANQQIVEAQEVGIDLDIIEIDRELTETKKAIFDRYNQLCRIIKGEGTRRPSKTEPILPLTEDTADASKNS